MTEWLGLPDLASSALGGGVVATNDEFFALADDLVRPEPAVFTPHSFGSRGQIYDGWETRRRREPGHDHAIIRLGAAGVIRGVVVDTAFFTGNYPPYASVEACRVPGYPAPAELATADWVSVVDRSPLKGDSRNQFEVTSPQLFTHVRLCIYPDGGVARFRVHGAAVPDPALLPAVFDLAAVENGGLIVACSNMFYSSPQNLLMPGAARVMGEGWETSRRRDGGNDWVQVRLGVPGRIELVELDTSHFKGNAPGQVTLRGVDARGVDLDDLSQWFELLPLTRSQPNTRHRFAITAAPPATHVRLDVFPDGGLARLRLYGGISASDRAALISRHGDDRR